MKIGIGVISYQRPAHLDLWRAQILKHTQGEYELDIYIDEPRRGIAYGKNQNLKALQHCDYIFLFDSDCFPIKDGWADYFIWASKLSRQKHFLYLKETGTIKKINTHQFRIGDLRLEDVRHINQYDNCGGCFMFLTKEVIEKVGGYNKNYGYYGFEHAGYSDRIHQAGLTPMGKYLCPEGAGDYVYAMDYDFHLPFNKQVKHHSSLENEIESVPTYIEQNRKVYLEDVQTIYQSL